MALIQGHFRVQDFRSQGPGLGAMSVVSISLFVGLILLKVTKALAVTELTAFTIRVAVAAAMEISLGGFDTFAIHHAVDEAKVAWEGILAYYGDRGCSVGWEGA